MSTVLLDAVQAHLITAGIARHNATAGLLPVAWLEMRDGVPAPGEGIGTAVSDPVIGLFTAQGTPTASLEGVLRNDGLDIRIRSTSAPAAWTLENQIRAELNDRRGYTLGATLFIVKSFVTVEMFRLSSGPQGFEYTMQYEFQRWSGIEPHQ